MIIRSIICTSLTLFLASNSAKAFEFNNETKLTCQDKRYDYEKLFNLAKDGVVIISSPEGLGSGFVVKHDQDHTFILTNRHVVGLYKKATVTWSNKEVDGALIVARTSFFNKDKDLALLAIKGKKGTVLKFKSEAASIGSEVIAIGSPSGLDFSITRGIVSGLRDNGRLVQTDTAINEGNSGGPLIDLNGCVIGINTFKLRDKEGLNFAISVKDYEDFRRSINFNSQLKTKILQEDLSIKGIAQYYRKDMINRGHDYTLKTHNLSFKHISEKTQSNYLKILDYIISLDSNNYIDYTNRGRLYTFIHYWRYGLKEANGDLEPKDMLYKHYQKMQ